MSNVNDKVAETRRLFTQNREARLVAKIRHLREHGWHEQADLLFNDLTAWRLYLAQQPVENPADTPADPLAEDDGL